MPAGPVLCSWRRYLRFSLRGLIVLVLVIGVWVGCIVRSARIQREAVAAAHPRLLEDMLQVYFDGARLDTQIMGDVPVTQPLFDQARNLYFTWSQLGMPLMGQFLGIGEDTILQPGIPAGDRPQTDEKSLRFRSSPQDAARPRLEKSQGFRFVDPAAPDNSRRS